MRARNYAPRSPEESISRTRRRGQPRGLRPQFHIPAKVRPASRSGRGRLPARDILVAIESVSVATVYEHYGMVGRARERIRTLEPPGQHTYPQVRNDWIKVCAEARIAVSNSATAALKGRGLPSRTDGTMDDQNAPGGHPVPAPSDGAEASSDPAASSSGPLLEAPRGVRARWAEQVGEPCSAGVGLNVGVRFLPVDHDGIDYQIRGVVDVPGPPYGDDERMYLAKVLLDSADLPRPRYEYALLDWEETAGGDGIRVDKCAPIPVLADDVLDVTTFSPPDVEETTDDRLGNERHAEWAREYGANPYCRHETREELHQRHEDIWVNTLVLKPSGRMGLTTDENWYRLQQHVLTEMLRRGEPPTPWNRHPRVLEARPFFDGDLCRKAARVVSARGTGHDVLVKYGKREHMEALFREGHVYLNSATSYNESAHNQAVRDDELAIAFKGGYVRATRPMRFYHGAHPPSESIADRGVGFRSVHELPELAADQYASMTIQMATDYWMFCLADLLDQRLFADFQADCCLIIRREPFVQRLLRAATFQLRNLDRNCDRVEYVDPLGAWPTGVRVTRSMPIHLTKVFRYAYQREVRFAFLPRRSQERLEPRSLWIKPVSDIAEFVPLPDGPGGHQSPR